MFKINGQPLKFNEDGSFNVRVDVMVPTDDGEKTETQIITCPGQNLSNQSFRDEHGITDDPAQPRPDDSFYWVADNGDGTFTVTPKDLDQLKAGLVAQVKQTTNTLLAPSDWKVTRKFERGIAIDADTVAYRARVIQASNDNEAAINATETVDTLAALLIEWPEVPK